MDSEQNKAEMAAVDLSLSQLTNDLERLKQEQAGRSQFFNSELSTRIDSLASNVESRGSSMLEVIGKADQTYRSEIDTLKGEVKRLEAAKVGLTSELGNSKTNEGSMHQQIKDLQSKIVVLESIDESNKGTWFDNPQPAHNLELSSAVDIDRVNKALKRCMDVISMLQKRLSDLEAHK